jgi:hypothetical protein
MSKKQLFIHVGYPKTGTTTLQNSLFKNHSELEYLNDKIDFQIFKEIRGSSSISFNSNFKNLTKDIVKHIKLSSKEKFIISNESFTSTAMHYGKVKRYNKSELIIFPDSITVIRNLNFLKEEIKDLVDVHILVCLRNQLDFLKTYYAQEYNRFYSINKETNTFEKFIDFSLKNEGNFMLESINYYNIVKNYSFYFGKEKIHVLLFENLIDDQKKYYQDLAINILKINVDESIALTMNKKFNSKKTADGYKTDGMSLSIIVARIASRLKFQPKIGLTNTKIFKILKKTKVNQKDLKDLQYSSLMKKSIIKKFRNDNKLLFSEFEINSPSNKYF